jgi:TRAP-type C4-dicarboxylate transport system permease small subunit
MALSNIFREPRREITESLAGTLLIGLLVLGDCLAANWVSHRLNVATRSDEIGLFVIALLFIPIVSFIALFFLVILPHWIGESICDSLARRGLELRPTQRYR